jgi:GNAT superfamily N-acetyltransferase
MRAGSALVHVCTWQAAYRNAFPAEVLDALSVDTHEQRWHEVLDEGAEPVWIAEDERDVVVGFASAGPSQTEEDVAELYAIYVRPDAWGGGAARKLMRAVIDWFIAEEYTTAMLWVLDDNPRARRFYEREGWRHDGTRTDSVRGVAVEEALYWLTLVGA